METGCFRRHVYLSNRLGSQNRTVKIRVLFFLLIFSLFLSPLLAFAGGTTLSLSEGGTHEVDSLFNVDVNLKSGGTMICAARAFLSFPANLVEVVSLSPGPVYNMEAVKRYSNQEGTISYTLAPKGGCTNTDSTIYRVVFKAKTSGRGEVGFTNAGVSVADSSGIARSILVGTNSATFTITGNSSNTGDPQPQNGNANTNTSSPAPYVQKTVAPANVGAALVNDNGLVTPNLQTVEFDPRAEFDQANKRSKGVIFYGTANPNVKVNLVVGKSAGFSTTSDSNGNWKAYFTDWLTDGVHILTAKSEKDGKFSSELITPFTLSSQHEKVVTGSRLPGVLTTQTGNEVNNKLSKKMLGIIIISTMLLLLLILAIIYWWLKKKDREAGKTRKSVA